MKPTRQPRSRVIACVVAVCGALVSSAQDAVPQTGEATALDSSLAIYHDYESVVAQLDLWATGVEGWSLERRNLGESRGGLEIPVLVFGREGALQLDRRPTVILIGGLDGTSLSGCEAVLEAMRALLTGDGQLPSDVAFAAIPWAAPDGLVSWVNGRGGPGTNARPTDDDNDGLVDEDGPDDADGDGAILDMLIPDPLGPWARAEDGRRLRAADVLDADRFLLVREGVDEDGDGRFNEDGVGGVDLDRAFPVGWRGRWDGVPGGPWPASEPSTRALAEFVTSRKSVVALLFQGSHGRCAVPGGLPRADGSLWIPAADRSVFETVTRLFYAAMGRVGPTLVPLHRAREEARTGAALDWLYAAGGVLPVEVAPWGPERKAESDADSERVDDDAWFEWVDNEHGGRLFQSWAPFDLGGGRIAWIGGWRPRTRANPPEEKLKSVLAGTGEFVSSVALSLPRLQIEVFERRRDVDRPELCHVGARLVNHGALPSGLALPGDTSDLGGAIQLEWEEGCELLVGRANQPFEHVPGRGASIEFRWILNVPQGARVTLRAQDRWSAPVSVEVRP